MSSSEAHILALQQRLRQLEGLLTEAREHITDKPWDDTTRLHRRISEALGLEVHYADWMKETDGLYDDEGETS
jgi:CHASE1-domain containing sensor protein